MVMDKPNVGRQERGSGTRRRDEGIPSEVHESQRDLIDFSGPLDWIKGGKSEDREIKQKPSEQEKGEMKEQNTSEKTAAENKWYWELLELDFFLQGPKAEREGEDAGKKEVKVEKIGEDLENLKIGRQPEEPELQKKGEDEQNNKSEKELKSEAAGEMSETESGVKLEQRHTHEQGEAETESRPSQEGAEEKYGATRKEESDTSERLRAGVRDRKIRRALIQAGLRIEGEKLELLKLIYAPRTRKELERLQKLDVSQWRDRSWEEQVRKMTDCFKKEKEERIEKE